MFGTSAMTPPSAYYPGSSSSMSFYHPPMFSQTPQITVHHLQFSQSHQYEDDDHDESHQQDQPDPEDDLHMELEDINNFLLT